MCYPACPNQISKQERNLPTRNSGDSRGDWRLFKKNSNLAFQIPHPLYLKFETWNLSVPNHTLMNEIIMRSTTLPRMDEERLFGLIDYSCIWPIDELRVFLDKNENQRRAASIGQGCSSYAYRLLHLPKSQNFNRTSIEYIVIMKPFPSKVSRTLVGHLDMPKRDTLLFSRKCHKYRDTIRTWSIITTFTQTRTLTTQAEVQN